MTDTAQPSPSPVRLDLVLRGGRVLDPGRDVDAVLDVGVAGARIARVEPAIPRGVARRVVDARGKLVIPGMIALLFRSVLSLVLSRHAKGASIMARIKLIHHVNVQISDRKRTREWYERVLGAEFLDRGPALNQRQLQLRIGTAEIHFTETPRPVAVPSAHFAVEVDDWEGMIAHLTQLGLGHARQSAASTGPDVGGTAPDQGRREDSGEHFTYIHDPDGNMIELVHHPLGMEDGRGRKVEAAPEAEGLHWVQKPGFVTAAYREESAAR